MADTPTDLALKYVREELSTLRASVHDELAAMRTDLGALAAEMRSHTAVIGPQIAVILHRLDTHDKDLEEIRQQRQSDLSSRRWGVGTWIAAVAALAAVAAVVVAIVALGR